MLILPEVEGHTYYHFHKTKGLFYSMKEKRGIISNKGKEKKDLKLLHYILVRINILMFV